MSYEHSNVHIVRVVDVMDNSKARTWYVGPYGSTRANQTANYLESVARDAEVITSRECYVEPLFSDDDCLRVADYGRTTLGSLR
ncbi:hypothetical protein [Williamsia sterculiae]|uniref:Uncharacterized protein n=1 Tax=Williamsia sterculiae TaxID=1344003 RepID=A0A1N7HEA3_9NOCA|nr:hypothetical protein [Williamsia sterculiae]SIS23093.1 hypothetical protein SAMN05445060_4051 [Williamsia sterculiae]